MKRRFAAVGIALLLALVAARVHQGRTFAAANSPEPLPAETSATDGAAAAVEPPVAQAPAAPEEKALVEMSSWSSGGCGSAVSGCFANMLRRQNADGSWGGDPETFEGHAHTKATATSLTLLSFLGAGYTHLSREAFEGRTVGASIKAAIQWLCSQRPADPFEASLMSLSLSEAYGLTNSALVRSLSEECRATFESWQRNDATRGDPLAEAFAGEAIASARLSDLQFDEGASDRATGRLRESLAAGATAEAAAVYVLLSKDKEHESFPELAKSLASSLPDWDRPNFTHWYFGTLALKLIEGPPDAAPAGESWKAWSLALKETLVTHQDRDGTWPGESGATGSAVRNAMATLSLELYYRYGAIIGGK